MILVLVLVKVIIMDPKEVSKTALSSKSKVAARVCTDYRAKKAAKGRCKKKFLVLSCGWGGVKSPKLSVRFRIYMFILHFG